MIKNHLDLITIGRVSMDLFSQNIGVPFVEIEGFETGVGGSPVNIAIGANRLGLRTATLTAVGDDEVGKFVRRYLEKEGVITDYIPTKMGTRTGLAVVGIQPPDKFPLVFYRENPADIYLTIEDVLALPLAQSRIVLLSGTALSRGSCRDATLFAAEQAWREGLTTFMDLDLRPDQWHDPRAYGLNIRTILANVDVVIGTEEEFFAALATDPGPVMAGQAVSEEQETMLETFIRELLTAPPGPQTLILKRGARGVTLYTRQGEVIDVAGFPVEVLNTVGAGDAFASGLIYSWANGAAWPQAARFANACGALVVTRHGCATAMPTLSDVELFLQDRTK